MTLLYYDPVFLEHRTGSHPECAQRLAAITAHLGQLGLDRQCRHIRCEPANDTAVARIHSRGYTDELAEFAAAGGGHIEADTVVSPRSYEVARTAAGAATDAVERVIKGEDCTALCLVRPPGHHALASSPMGFCLLNNVAIAAAAATRKHGLDRVLVVDFDVHHGNGTQAVFWTDPQVGFMSIHRWPFYPGTGTADETGTGDALGTILNLPIPFGTPRREYLQTFRDELDLFATRMRPQLVLVSAGFDAHAADPVGSLGLEAEDFETLTDALLDVAEAHAGGRLVSILEGGYNPAMLALSVEAHVRRLLARSGPKTGAGK